MRLRTTWVVLMLGVLAGLGMALSATTITHRVGAVWLRQPTRAAHAAEEPSTQPWSPQIAFQHYETGGGDAQFLAEHVDWLMMRYGAERLRDEVREHGYAGDLPQYLLTFQIYGPGPYEDRDERCKNDYTPLQNNVMWTRDFCELVHPHEDWFLHNRDGERLYTKQRIWDGSHVYQYFMNPGSEGFRRFWIDQVRRQGEAGWESIFLDNVSVTYAYIGRRADNEDGSVAEYASVEAWQTAMVGMLRAIRAAFPERPIWGNIVEAPHTADAWDRYRPELDGMQEEQFATGWLTQPPLAPQAWEAMLARADRTLADGKSVVLYGQGEQDDYGRMRFSLASYLLVATPDRRATFRYARTSDYEVLWWYPEYDQNYGAPLGPRYRDGEWWVREYACAWVKADPARRVGAIDMKPCPAA
jgi:hypothetical protein